MQKKHTYYLIVYNDVVLARAIKIYGGLFDADRVCGPVDTGPRLSRTIIKLDCIFVLGYSQVVNFPKRRFLDLLISDID